MSYIGNVVNVISANLSEDLDVSGQDIISSSNGNIEILPDGSGKVHIDGNGTSGGVVVSDGLIEIKTGTGSVGELRFYCESSNLHYTSLKSAAHGTYSGNVVLTLPSSDGNSGEYLKTDGNGVLSWDTPSGGGGSQNLFSTIAVSGQSDVVADSTTDTLTLVAGSGITLTTDASTDSITIASSGGGGGGNTDILTLATTSSSPTSVAQDIIKLFEENSALVIRSYRGNAAYQGVVLKNSDGTAVSTMYTDGDISSVNNMIAKKFVAEGGSVTGKIQLQAPNTTDHIGIEAPSSLSGSTNYVFPADGSSGEYLKTDGSGNLSWDTPSGGGGGGSFPLTGDVGLGGSGNTASYGFTTAANMSDFMEIGPGGSADSTYRNIKFTSSINTDTETWIGFRDGSSGTAKLTQLVHQSEYNKGGEFRTMSGAYTHLLGGSYGYSYGSTPHVLEISNAASNLAGCHMDFGLAHASATYRFTNAYNYASQSNFYYSFPRVAPGGAGEVLESDANGNCAWASNSSDNRLKKNIEDNEVGLDFINDLNTVKFEFKSFKEINDTHPELEHYQPLEDVQEMDDVPNTLKEGTQLGLIAQELLEVMGKHDCEDFKGHWLDNHGVHQIKKEELIVPLIKAVQELSKRVEELEEKI